MDGIHRINDTELVLMLETATQAILPYAVLAILIQKAVAGQGSLISMTS